MLHEIVPVADLKEVPTEELHRRLAQLRVAENAQPKPEKDCRECGNPLSSMELSAEHLAGTGLCSRCFRARHAH